jgi:hypothetical protein
MARVGLEPTVSVFERLKIFRALNGAATGMGVFFLSWNKRLRTQNCFARRFISVFVYVILICVCTHEKKRIRNPALTNTHLLASVNLKALHHHNASFFQTFYALFLMSI